MEEAPQDTSLANLAVFNKYKAAGEIANAGLQFALSLCVPGADIADLCTRSDLQLEESLQKIFNKKRLEKGIAFPTCVSVNNVCGYFSPLREDSLPLEAGQLIKVDLGVHIDGFIANAATTAIVGGASPITGRAADLILAAHTAAEAGLRLMRPGNSNYQVTEAIQKSAAAYAVHPMEGCISHQFKQHVIDGNKCIINKETVDQRVEEVKFEPNEVYGLDVFVSTGEGKARESEVRSSVFKRNLEVTYSLKMKASRAFFAEVNDRFPTLLFTLRAFEDLSSAKMGVSECQKHMLVHSFPVLQEVAGELVAQVKYTVAILPNKTLIIAGLPIDPATCQSDHTVIDPELLATLAINPDPKKAKK